jgi:Fe-S oxidoreductase
MGLIDWWARLGVQMPALANFFSQTAPFSTLLKAAGGIAEPRRLPPFARQTFTAWYAQRLAHRTGGPPVVLYPDAFNEYFHPETLRAAVLVLERLGYSVIVPERRYLPAIRPLLHFGMLDMATRSIRAVLRHLHPFLAEGIPIVGLEPTTVAVFRDEVLNLMPHDLDGQRLAQTCYLLCEFLDEQEVELPQLKRSAVLHTPCHQKAVLKPHAMENRAPQDGGAVRTARAGLLWHGWAVRLRGRAL